MKKVYTYALLFFIANYCWAQTAIPERPVEKPAHILKDLNSFLDYWGANLKLSEDFTAYDPASQVISKGVFLKLLTTGEYLPLRLNSKNASLSYKLYKLNSSAGDGIRGSIKGWAEDDYAHYKMEGKKFPGFNFVDLNGKKYNEQTTKGEIIVLKCWFIKCATCVKEIPALNRLVTQYKNRKDILFVSLALDSKEKLKDFLTKTTFNYAVVPNQEAYIEKVLKINSYPTHIIINKQGVIIKVVNASDEVASELKRL